MGLEWGDMYKRTDALGFTVSKKPVHESTKSAVPPPSYDIREDLFERDEDFFQEMGGQDFQVGSVYPSYTPSRQISSSFALQLPAINEDNDDEIYFPSYDDIECSDKIELMESSTEASSATQQPVSPDPVERPEDDTAIRAQPSRHVDYLSHDWSEEDVWASWQHIVSKRGAYNNSARLENASWRSWAQKRSNLRTVPPETVKWMKDHDLTWLYGPLTPGTCEFGGSCPNSTNERRMSRAGLSCPTKKPILKKRSPSEILLQKSISTSLLAKRGSVANLEGRNSRDHFPFDAPALTRSSTGMVTSKSISGLETPEGWKKVQFHELVEQCIALANAGDEDHEYHYCSDSDDDVIVMRKAKKRASSKWLPASQPKKQASFSKTIEKLPHAPLKYPEELEDVPEEEVDVESGMDSTSPSSLDDSPDPMFDYGSDEEENWQPPAWLRERKDSVQIVKDKLFDIKMKEEAITEATSSNRPQLERRHAAKERDGTHVPLTPQRVGSDSSIKFELPPCRSQLATFSFQPAPTQHLPRDDYFMAIDPGMTEGESDDSLDMSRSSSQSSDSPDLALDNFQRTLVDRAMDKFWILFNQRLDSASPLAGPASSLSARKRRRGDQISSSRARLQRKANAASVAFDTPDQSPSPDPEDAADYESYLHRELPLLVKNTLIAAVRRDSQPQEATLIAALAGIIQECQDKTYESYIETTDKTQGLGMSIDPFQTPKLPTEDLPSVDTTPQYASPFPSSTSEPSPLPPTPAETFSNPNINQLISNNLKYALPKEMRGKDPRTMKEWDIYDEIDEAVAWAQVF